MNRLPIILIFDVGKTHKKLLLINEAYHIVHEESYQFDQIADEDGFPCEDVSSLTNWIQTSCTRFLNDNNYLLLGINFSAYGASLVYLSEEYKILFPLYNYLKPYLQSTLDSFIKKHGPVRYISQQTASPQLGSLNSGLQLYRIKIEKPSEYDKIKFVLHLPQYLSFVLTGKCFSDLTSIGCHTMLWDFRKLQYHEWAKQESLDKKLAPIKNADQVAGHFDNSIPVGIGLHDSSSALVPYLQSFYEPFILISTGTWCISLNPFNDTPLTVEELDNDTLFYLSYKGKPVKASRIFAGNEHERQVKRLSQHFAKPDDYYQSVNYDPGISIENNKWLPDNTSPRDKNHIPQSAFPSRDLHKYPNFETAYHQLISDIVQHQLYSAQLILRGSDASSLFVDGGFSQNEIYMSLLVQAFPALKIYAAAIPHASAIGAAVAIHSSWNKNRLPDNLVSLKYYFPKTSL